MVTHRPSRLIWCPLGAILLYAGMAMGAPDVAVIPFTIPHDSLTIAGEIHRHAGTEPETAVIVLGGSGVCERQDTAGALPVFLTETAAVVLIDRRGCGASTGTFTRPGTTNSRWLVPLLAEDVTAVVDHLRATGFERVGLAGSSFGGWLAVATAAANEVDFFIAINGGGSSVAVSDAFDHFTDGGMSIDAAIAATRAADLAESYDPAADLAKTTIPGLWILGELDDSNPMVLDRAGIEHAISLGKPFEILVLEGTDHEMRIVGTGEVNLSWLERARAFVDNAGG